MELNATMNITPEKVKGLLSSFIYTSVEETTDPDVERNQSISHWTSSEFKQWSPTSDITGWRRTRPRDRAAFFDRVNTYNAECCQRLLSSLKSGHKSLCPWINYPSPESFLYLSMGGHENIKKARVTVEELETLGQLLPIISRQAWAEMDLSEKDLNTLVQLLIKDLDNPQTSDLQKDFTDDLPLSFPGDSTLTSDQTKVLLTVCGWNVSCHSTHTRHLLEEERKVLDSETDNRPAVGDVVIEKVVFGEFNGDEKLSSDNNIKQPSSGLETDEDVKNIVSDLLDHVISCCASKVDHQEGDNKGSTSQTSPAEGESALGCGDLLQGQTSTEMLEGSESVERQNSKCEIPDIDVVCTRDNPENIISEVIGDIIRKCCDIYEPGSIKQSTKPCIKNYDDCELKSPGEDLQETSFICDSLIMDEGPEALLVENSIVMPVSPQTDEDLILARDGVDCVGTVRVVNHPAEQCLESNEISDEFHSDDGIVGSLDAEQSAGSDDDKVADGAPTSDSEKTDSCTVVPSLAPCVLFSSDAEYSNETDIREMSQSKDVVLPEMDTDSTSDVGQTLCTSEDREDDLAVDTPLNRITEVSDQCEREKMIGCDHVTDSVSVESAVDITSPNSVTIEDSFEAPVFKTTLSYDPGHEDVDERHSVQETISQVTVEFMEISDVQTTVTEMNTDVYLADRCSGDDQITNEREQDIQNDLRNYTPESQVPRQETSDCLIGVVTSVEGSSGRKEETYSSPSLSSETRHKMMMEGAKDSSLTIQPTSGASPQPICESHKRRLSGDERTESANDSNQNDIGQRRKKKKSKIPMKESISDIHYILQKLTSPVLNTQQI
ncbi:hypothetical protein LSH36_367g07013 [Paralvinella palmiformis]|uniref:Uncharacterized protein n=1 Tax=Paralvinella palmiformis TaxID=53620 RepID=A0AAD9JEV6_9ANNE|nr:hypothetical protein LSH36_367g07013 [Paralvinella palmiformis]